MFTSEAFVIFVLVLIVAEAAALVYIFLIYDRLMWSLIRQTNPDVMLPESANEMKKMLEADRKRHDEKQRIDDFFNLLKNGEASDEDIEKYGIGEAING